MLTLGLIGTMILAGCGRTSDADESMTKLRIGVLPDESREILARRFEPMRAYLEATTGIPCELITPDSYETLLSRFIGGEIDFAYFGGYTFVVAREETGAVPLVLRPEDRQFVSYCLVAGTSTATSVDDLAGARLAFGSKLSTSGHLMPRYFLDQEGVTPEKHFGEIRYTGSHDATARAVRDGEVDVGYANALIIDAMLRDGRLAEDDIRVLYETPPYTDYVWAVRPEISDDVKRDLTDAFLALDPERDDHHAILRAVDASAYFPAAPNEFDAIALTVERMAGFEDAR
ncbi:MAG: phosphate/phosphite/phosphonate ABC transporter substrate-binding protein [Phycisphaerales bacterium]|nr:phosphate/phosphite/phosphonate ABC transporter substrate-binding protein [Phycisphaerae bacterium]NNM25041.1 phosphate/phosphite/phosphonate ABC transporter substrate-binding protein [Phycisphaerales bacterium]